MSKSRGNIVRSETILEVLGADALRYFLFREIPFGQDGSFSFDALVQRYNSDLANGLGNLASRTMSMIHRYFEGAVPEPSLVYAGAGEDAACFDPKTAHAAIAGFAQKFDEFNFNGALVDLWSFMATVDDYITKNAPWKLASSEDPEAKDKLRTVLYNCAEALRIITVLAHPIIPDSTKKIFTQLGLGDVAKAELNSLGWGQLPAGTRLGPVEAVFPRADKSAIERMQKMEEERKAPAAPVAESAAPAAAPVATPAPAAAAPAVEGAAPADGPMPLAPQITLDDFVKVDLRVATVLTAEKVEKADKLLRLTVDLGFEQRQIVAGIAKAYAPESLVGRKVVIVANLAPRKLRGIESNGMIVAASFGEHGTPALASFLEEVPNGSRLK